MVVPTTPHEPPAPQQQPPQPLTSDPEEQQPPDDTQPSPDDASDDIAYTPDSYSTMYSSSFGSDDEEYKEERTFPYKVSEDD